MKTLIIHLKDTSTNFLNRIYFSNRNNNEVTIINNNQISKHTLHKLIEKHDRIIMLGHGTKNGLLRPIQIKKYPYKTFPGFIIDSRTAYLLREKHCIGIWCNAIDFFQKYKLHGFATGMIVSEYEEAIEYSLPCDLHNLIFANIKLTDAIEKAITFYDEVNFPISKFIKIFLKKEKKNNRILEFNINNLFDI